MKSRKSRRSFLASCGAASGAALLPGKDLATADEDGSGEDCRDERSRQARRLRLEIAKADARVEVSPQKTNGDSDRYPSHLANFSKGLTHNELAIVDPAGYELLLRALASGNWFDFENIPLGRQAKLSNPMAAFAFSLEGVDSHQTRTPPPPAFASEAQAAEMIELYWHALTRDVPYVEFESNPLIAKACFDLSKFGPTSEVVTPATIFRLPFPGCFTGPYVSQFLLLDVPVDNEVIQQQYPSLAAGSNAMTDYASFLSIQNGALPGPGTPLAAPHHPATPRDLVSYVHKDLPFQADQNAALILSSFGTAALSDSNPV